MTDIQFLRKSKPESCRPCTSNGYTLPQRQEMYEMYVCVCRVMESVVKMMIFGKASGQMTDIQFLRKSKPESCRLCIIHAFCIAPEAEDKRGAWVITDCM
jgi:hypothetical protein